MSDNWCDWNMFEYDFLTYKTYINITIKVKVWSITLVKNIKIHYIVPDTTQDTQNENYLK